MCQGPHRPLSILSERVSKYYFKNRLFLQIYCLTLRIASETTPWVIICPVIEARLEIAWEDWPCIALNLSHNWVWYVNYNKKTTRETQHMNIAQITNILFCIWKTEYLWFDNLKRIDPHICFGALTTVEGYWALVICTLKLTTNLLWYVVNLVSRCV